MVVRFLLCGEFSDVFHWLFMLLMSASQRWSCTIAYCSREVNHTVLILYHYKNYLYLPLQIELIKMTTQPLPKYSSSFKMADKKLYLLSRVLNDVYIHYEFYKVLKVWPLMWFYD